MTDVEILERAITQERKYSEGHPPSVGDVVGHDSTEFSGTVLSVDGDVAVVDFTPIGSDVRDVRAEFVAELIDVHRVLERSFLIKLGGEM